MDSDLAAIKCWGRNQYGQLGLGDTVTRGDQQGEMGTNLRVVDLGNASKPIDLGFFTPIRLALGGYYSCAVSVEGNLKCWGMLDVL